MIVMNLLFKNLKISQKLNILGFVGVIGLLLSGVIVWLILSNLSRISDKVQVYSLIKEKSSDIRGDYNSVHGDLM